jgi:hypothetical protein
MPSKEPLRSTQLVTIVELAASKFGGPLSGVSVRMFGFGSNGSLMSATIVPEQIGGTRLLAPRANHPLWVRAAAQPSQVSARVRDVAKEVLGVALTVNMRVGGSGSRWYRQHVVPTVVYSLTPFNMGGPDEHILVNELGAVAKVHTLAAFDYLTSRS